MTGGLVVVVTVVVVVAGVVEEVVVVVVEAVVVVDCASVVVTGAGDVADAVTDAGVLVEAMPRPASCDPASSLPDHESTSGGTAIDVPATPRARTAIPEHRSIRTPAAVWSW